jgi:hypothetical protein
MLSVCICIPPVCIIAPVPTTPAATPAGLTAAPLGATGLAVNGVAFFSPDDASSNDAVVGEEFDVCGTHPTATGSLHYHTTPLCLIGCLGGTVPATADWPFLEAVRAGNIRDWVAKWPATGTAVLLGYMLDGRKIYSPYDEAGNIHAWGGIFDGSASVKYGNTQYEGDFSDVRSRLDECNGAMRGGEYVYYATPSPPWTPPCLKTNTLGTITNACTAVPCPNAGLACTGSAGFTCAPVGTCSATGAPVAAATSAAAGLAPTLAAAALATVLAVACA